MPPKYPTFHHSSFYTGGGGGQKVRLLGNAKNVDEPFAYCQMEKAICSFLLVSSVTSPKTEKKETRKSVTAIVLTNNGTVFPSFVFQDGFLAFLSSPTESQRHVLPLLPSKHRCLLRSLLAPLLSFGTSCPHAIIGLNAAPALGS